MSSAHNVSETHQGNLNEIAQNVFSYIQPDGTWFINNMGLIVGKTEAISIDTTSTERRNRSYIDAIEVHVSGCDYCRSF
jgi:cyclase